MAAFTVLAGHWLLLLQADAEIRAYAHSQFIHNGHTISLCTSEDAFEETSVGGRTAFSKMFG